MVTRVEGQATRSFARPVQPLKRYFPWGDARQYPNLFAMLAGRAAESMRLNNDRGFG